jgi:hypothetical protein
MLKNREIKAFKKNHKFKGTTYSKRENICAKLGLKEKKFIRS